MKDWDRCYYHDDETTGLAFLFFLFFLVFFGLDRWTGRDFATMDGEEDEMTRDEMRYLLRGGVVLYYFPFLLGKGERVLSCQYFHQEDSIEISDDDDFLYSDLIFSPYDFLF